MGITKRYRRVVLATLVTVVAIGAATYGYHLYQKPDRNRITAASCLRQVAMAGLMYADPEKPWKALEEGGKVIIMRHAATTPGDSDPPDFRLDDRSTQRNLSDEGREQARKIAEAFRKRGIKVQRVISSQYARCLDTAELAFGTAEQEPVFNSLPSPDAPGYGKQWIAMLTIINNWSGPGNLVIVTHSRNIDATTRQRPGPADMVVLKPVQHTAEFVGVLPIARIGETPATQPSPPEAAGQPASRPTE